MRLPVLDFDMVGELAPGVTSWVVERTGVTRLAIISETEVIVSAEVVRRGNRVARGDQDKDPCCRLTPAGTERPTRDNEPVEIRADLQIAVDGLDELEFVSSSVGHLKPLRKRGAFLKRRPGWSSTTSSTSTET